MNLYEVYVNDKAQKVEAGGFFVSENGDLVFEYKGNVMAFAKGCWHQCILVRRVE